jgi:signal-transduction protein with cAMP-binding, CBS, and nucleotidyltransferase domain
MLVSQIMKKDFSAVPPTASIQEAAKKMKNEHAGMAIVLDKGRVKGVLTEKQVATAMTAHTDNPQPSPALAAAARKPSSDEGNRCCYLNEVQAELLLNP